MQLLGAVLALALAPAPPPQPPPAVPLEAETAAPARDVRVVRSWAAAIRKDDFPRAAALFADGALVQNAGPPERLRTRVRRHVWNATLPCGAEPVEVGASRGYAIVTFLLVERRGGDCAGGAGNTVRVAMRIERGRITGWFRLPESRAPGPPPSPFG
jgi:hypothetical protein